MLKRFFSFFILSFISFSLTTLAINYIKSIDPLMIYIKENVLKYEVEPVDAHVDDLSVIPGQKGQIVDVDSSYSLMKKYGTFREELLIYKDVVPNVSISNIYNKYVYSGNQNKNDVSFVFKINNDFYIKDIVEILKSKDIVGTFFLSNELIYNKDIIIYLYLNNQEIEYYNNKYNFNELKEINIFFVNYISRSLRYCLNDVYNKDNIDICSMKRMHMIIPNINTYNYPFYDVVNNISNGSIIKFEGNRETVKELRHIINYIRQKDYNIVSLKKMLEE